MPDQPKTYTKEYVDQLTEQLHEARKEADWFKSRCCHWWNIFKTDEPVPMLNWIINKTPVIIWAFDVNGVFMLSEGKALASLGLKPGEVVGKSAFEIYADHPEIMDTVKQVLSGKHLTKEVNVNGCFFEVEHIPMYDSSQNLVGAVGVALEVTRRRYAEQSLKSKENLFQEIFDALPIAVVTATPDRKIERLNPAAEQLFGYTNSNDKRVTIFMHDITDRIQQEELEREKIAAELHEVVSEMLESHENNRAGFQDKLKGKSLTPREMEVLRVTFPPKTEPL